MNITENIKYKLSFILEKIKNNEKLTKEEQEYYSMFQKISSLANTLEYQTALEVYNPNNQEIQDFIAELEQKIKNTIPKTASKKKLASFAEAITRIKKLQSGHLELLHELMIDAQLQKPIQFDTIIRNLMRLDDYTNNATAVGGHDNEFIKKENYYTKELELDEPTINLALELIGGNWTIYSTIQKLKEKYYPQQIPVQEWETIPEHLRGANTHALSRIAYYGRGRIGNPKEEKIFYKTADILEFALYLSNARKPKHSTMYAETLNTQFKEMILGYLDLPESFIGKKTARIKEEQLTRYIPLAFWNGKNTYPINKYRSLMQEYNYNIREILYRISKNDMICTTRFSKSTSGFINTDHTLNYATIALAAEYVVGNTRNYNILVEYYKTGDETILQQIPTHLRDADPSQLERIVYYGRGRIGNHKNHDLDEDYYNIQILEALAAYQEYAKTKGINIWEQEKASTKTKRNI